MTFREHVHAFRRALLVHSLAATGGNVTRAASNLGLRCRSLRRLLHSYHLRGRGRHAPNKRGDAERWTDRRAEDRKAKSLALIRDALKGRPE